MDSLKGKIRSQMEVMEAALGKPQLLRWSLARKLGNAETDWTKVEGYYTHILTLISKQEAEDGHPARPPAIPDPVPHPNWAGPGCSG